VGEPWIESPWLFWGLAAAILVGSVLLVRLLLGEMKR